MYTLKELRQVYLRLSRKYHPDKSVRKNSKEIFQNIKEAYDALKEEVSTDDIKPKPSETAGLLSLTSKDDSQKTKGLTEYLKEKLLNYLPQIIVLGAKVSKKLIELAISALKLLLLCVILRCFLYVLLSIVIIYKVWTGGRILRYMLSKHYVNMSLCLFD
jgi:hypothetical protein